MKKKATVFLYNSVNDPLFRATLYLYMVTAGESGGYDFKLITYEQEEFALSREEKKALKRELEENNIHWSPLNWHSGKFKLIKKLWDFLMGFLLVFGGRLSGRKLIISLGTVSGSITHVFSRMLFMDHYLYQYEPHAEFLRDFGLINPNSFTYRKWVKLERAAGVKAKAVATGTRHMIETLKQRGARGKAFLLPSSVNDERFKFLEEGRSFIRKKYGLQDAKVLLYLGKFGGIYYEQEAINFFAEVMKNDPSYKMMIVTPDDHQWIKEMISCSGMDSERFIVTKCDFEEVPNYISAADLGFVTVPPLPTQKYRSPIKVGEYLCCGLPYVVCKGVSEDDEVALDKKVGIVIDDFNPANASEVHDQAEKFFGEEPEILKSRCREAGIAYRGYSVLKNTGEEIFRYLKG